MIEWLGLLEPLFWLIEFLARGLIGWRFLLSSQYRAATRARWRTVTSSTVALEVTGGVVGMVASSLLVAWLASLIL
jgi:hypothetical protein